MRCFRLASAAVALSATLVAAAPTAWSFPWDIDMYRGQPVQPLAVAPRVMPSGTMPIAGGEPPMTRELMTVRESNPLKPTAENLTHGRQLFMTNCAPCHGRDARGDGPVVHLLKRQPANLVSGLSKELPDGYIYGTIRNGGIAMPSYSDAMSVHERWQVVLFVRQLQHAGAEKASAAK